MEHDRAHFFLSAGGVGLEAYRLRLYIAGVTPVSLRAVANVRQLCEEYLRGRYDLVVVDVYQQPGLALDARVMAVPTLVRQAPAPSTKLIGSLSSTEQVLLALGLCP